MTASGQTDEPAIRDAWSYVVFLKNSFAQVSAVSNKTAPAPGYALGDVSNGLVAGQGDNLVSDADVSLLGAFYGISGSALITSDVSYLDVGPTTDLALTSRPFTDGRIDFEDLIVLVEQFQGARPTLRGQARALAQWHENARCCGHCGGTTLVKDGGWRRKCWACGLEWFPRTDPVVIMLITDGERCLLAHEHRYGNKMYSTLAGFIEPGEDIEHAVRREVLEETNIQVGEVKYHSSQPWPFPHSLMLGCIGRALTTDITIDAGEIAEARWFSKADVRAMLERRHPEELTVPGKHAIANALITTFVGAA